MSIFEKLSGAQVQGRGVKITEDGEFIVEIDSIKLQESNRNFGTLFIVEFKLVQSSTMNHPVGSARSWVQMPEKRADTDPGNVKAFLAALMGVDGKTTEIPASAFEAAVGPDQPYKGHRVKLTTQAITTQSNQPFTIHNWDSATGQEQIETRPGAQHAAPAPMPAAPAPAGVPAAPEPPAPPAAPAAPEPPPRGLPLTKETWLTGSGPAVPHPGAPGWEFNPDHRDWGSRKVQA